jgi:hypothetical protein
MKYTGYRFLLLLFLSLQIAVCAKTDAVDPASFKLYILKQDEFGLRLGYELEESWSILQKVDLTDSYRVITADDIQVYDWSSQTITLTQKTSDYLKLYLGRKSSEW